MSCWLSVASTLTYLLDNYVGLLIMPYFICVDDIKFLRFESWWIEAGERNQISVIYRLDGQPHEIIIKDTKYYVKEIYSGEKRNHGMVVDCWDLHVGCKVDVFGKTTILKQCDLKTAEWNQFYGSFLSEMKNTFIEELKKYERKALDPKLTRACQLKAQCTTNLRDLMSQVTSLKHRMAQYRPLLSDDIIVAFESLL